MQLGGSCGQILANDLLEFLHAHPSSHRTGNGVGELFSLDHPSLGKLGIRSSFTMGAADMAKQGIGKALTGSGSKGSALLVDDVPQDSPPPPRDERAYEQQLRDDTQKGDPSQNKYGSDKDITKMLKGVSDDIKESGTSEEAILETAFGKKVMRTGLPVFDNREHDDVGTLEQMGMKNRYPGGDVMHQAMWAKWRGMGTFSGTVPPEEDWYAGARLGEYARPLIMGPQRVGYLNQAPVPMSPSEDLLTLVSEAGVGSRRASNAAMYAKQTAGQAMEFFRLAQRRARQIFHDPPVTVRPGGDVWPFYSAASPVLLGPPPTRRRQIRRHSCDSAKVIRTRRKGTRSSLRDLPHDLATFL